MKIRTLSFLSLALSAVFLFAPVADARTQTNTLRSGSLAPSTGKLATTFVNRAKDISIGLPSGWVASESESWSRSSDGVEDYTETVYLNDAKSYASVSITASAASDTTLKELITELESNYSDEYYTILSQGTTTVGTDPAYFIEVKSSYSHYKDYVLVKGGWKYDISASTDSNKWNRYSKPIQAALNSVRITAVP